MTLSALTILIIGLVAVVILVIGLWAYGTANRLDRLHVRSDQAWQSLEAALARRSVVMRGVATGSDGIDGRALTALADRAERAERPDREAAENAVSVALSQIDIEKLKPQMVSELADAEARVLIARRFHNDAVRDTLALRRRRPVRWLRLGGTAPLPTYFEISERPNPSALTGRSLVSTRTSARIVLLDSRGRVLLMRGHDPTTPDVYFWFTIGGGVEAGETLKEAAIRELKEETGLTMSVDDLRGPMWRRVATFPFDGVVIKSEELFFATRTEEFEPVASGFTDLEQRSVTGHRWCSAEDIRSLAASGETVYPYGMAELLDEADTVVALRTDPEVRTIH